MTTSRILKEVKGILKTTVGSCGGNVKDKLLELGMDIAGLAIGVVVQQKLSEHLKKKDNQEETDSEEE